MATEEDDDDDRDGDDDDGDGDLPRGGLDQTFNRTGKPEAWGNKRTTHIGRRGQRALYMPTSRHG